MTIVICPVCKSDLTEPGKHHDVECIKCGNEFDKADAEFEEASMSQIHARLVDIQKHVRENGSCANMSRRLGRGG
jgi:hypothetical protein